MKLELIIFVWSILDVTKGENCDGSHMTLHDMELRVSNNTDQCQYSGANCITDAYLAIGWYDVGSRNMPTDPSGLRTYSSCGTHWPIWLNGTIPKISDGRVKRKACLKSPSNICDRSYSYAFDDEVEVINCGTHMLYKLSPAPFSWIAFCFDPTKPSLELATVEPGLSFRDQKDVAGRTYKKPQLYLRCQFKGNDTDELFYYVYWYVNDLLLERKGPVQLSAINETDLLETELIQSGYKLDININCIINSSKNSEDTAGNSTTSLVFWLGIRVLNPNVNMIQGSTTTIQLQPTFPFGCSSRSNDRNPQAKCLLSVHVFDQDDTNDCKGSSISVQEGQRCGVQLTGFYHHQWTPGVIYDNVTEMKITTRDTNDYQQGRSRFVLKLLTKGIGLNDIVQGYYINNIIVTTSTVSSWQAKTCYSYVDPHMRSFDGRYYENQNIGVFILYRHRSSKQEVQMKTKQCNNVATCACAVAVRAGGDIFLIDLCRSPALIKHVSCKENILDVRQENPYLYKIYMPLGTMVSVAINNWWGYESTLNLNIYPSVKDVQETHGLCGVLNDNQGDDFTTSNGNIVYDNNVFSVSWRINQMQSFFDPENHNPDVWDEHSLFCVCPAALITATLQSNSSESEFYPVCSASLSLSCNKKSEIKGVQYQSCKIRTKRSKQSMTREMERILRKEVVDGDIQIHNVEKRSIINITLEEAFEECKNFFSTNCSTALFEESLPESNHNSMNSSITNCALDYTYTGDMSLASLHCETYRSEVAEEIGRNSTFREANPEIVESFRAMACINNCNNHGDCVNGSCICHDLYIEEDCSVSLSNYPAVEDTYSGGLCQKDKDECCGEIPIYGSRFVMGITKQRQEIFNIYLNGTTVVEEPSVEAISVINPFEAQIYVTCQKRRRRSPGSDNSSIPFVTGTRVSLTNDGTNYGSTKSYYILDTKCQGIFNDTNGYIFYLLDGTCFISGTCYSTGEQDSFDTCMQCQPTSNQFSWTYKCIGSKTDLPVSMAMTTIIVSVSVVSFVIALVIVGILIMKCCFQKEKRIAANCENYLTVQTPGRRKFDVAMFQPVEHVR